MANNLGAAAIPLANAQNVAQMSGIPLQGDDRLPLAVKEFQPVDDVANQEKMMKLQTDQMNFQNNKQDFDTQQMDKSVIDNWFKSGGRLNSPEDFQKATDEIGPMLSPKGQAMLNKASADHTLKDIDMKEKLAKSDVTDVASQKFKLDQIAESLDPIVGEYKAAMQSTGMTEEQKEAAKKSFMAKRDATLQFLSQQKDAAGKPMYKPETIQAFASQDPDTMEHSISRTNYSRQLHEQALADKLKEANIGKAESQAVYNTARAEDLPEKERIAQNKLDEMIKSKSLSGENLDSVATAIANYKLPPLSAYSMKTPQGLAIMSKVEEMTGGEYDSKKFKAMSGTLDKYTYGKGSEVITAFKTANSHLDALGSVVDQLDNGDEKSINRLGNAFAKEFNLSKAPGDFDAMKQAIAQEIEKTFSGSAGALADRQELEKSLDAAKSPENLKSVINDYKTLLQGKISASKESFDTGMSGAPSFDLKKKESTPAPAGFPKGTPADTTKGKSEQMAILDSEKADIEKRLAAAATPEDKAREQANLEDITRTIAAAGGKAPAAAAKPTTSNW